MDMVARYKSIRALSKYMDVSRKEAEQILQGMDKVAKSERRTSLCTV